MKKNMRTAFSTRQYMISKDFEIYYYSDKNMKRVSSHTHNYYEFYFFLSGAVSIEIDKTSYPLSYGDVIVIPPKVRHHMDILDSSLTYSRFVFWISRDYYEQLISASSDYGYLLAYISETKNYIFHFDRLTFNSIQSKIIRLIEELQGERFGRSAQLSLCVGDLMLNLNREIYKLKHPMIFSDQQNLCQELLSYIEEHLDESLLLNHLSEEFYTSKYHISHIFKENMGISIHQYILKKRLELSREAILTHASIHEAMLLCGFGDYSSFYRAFKKEYGISPKEYRKQHIVFKPNS